MTNATEPTNEANEKTKRSANTKRKSVVKKLDIESAKTLSSIKERINKKPFGRAIRDSEIIARALNLITEEDIVQLQDASYSERDRLYLAHADYARQNGRISLDEFIGRLIRGEIPTSTSRGRST